MHEKKKRYWTVLEKIAFKRSNFGPQIIDKSPKMALSKIWEKIPEILCQVIHSVLI